MKKNLPLANDFDWRENFICIISVQRQHQANSITCRPTLCEGFFLFFQFSLEYKDSFFSEAFFLSWRTTSVLLWRGNRRYPWLHLGSESIVAGWRKRVATVDLQWDAVDRHSERDSAPALNLAAPPGCPKYVALPKHLTCMRRRVTPGRQRPCRQKHQLWHAWGWIVPDEETAKEPKSGACGAEHPRWAASGTEEEELPHLSPRRCCYEFNIRCPRCTTDIYNIYLQELPFGVTLYIYSRRVTWTPGYVPHILKHTNKRHLRTSPPL